MMFINLRPGVKQRRGTARRRAGRSGRRHRVEQLEDRALMSADAVLDWNAVALDAVKNDYAVGQTSDQGGPTRASRALAIVHAAIYDAVNAIDRSYAPYLVDVHAGNGASMEAAVAQAGHDTLAALFPRQTATFDAALATSLEGIAHGAAGQGIKLGHEVASQILAARAHDGSDEQMMYMPGTLPGQHRPDPLHPDQGFLTSMWGAVTPFAMTSDSQFRAAAPPALTSVAYAAAFNEVKSLGGDGITTPTQRTAEQTTIGIFWGYDGSPGVGVPPRLYNQITRTIAQQEHNSEVQNARLFALVNIAMADAGIASWETKYTFNFWRPVLGIRESDPGTGPSGLGDGNPLTAGDPTWTPLGAPNDNGGGTNFTPPFPACTSGHATFGAATFRTIRDFYGTDNIPFSVTSDEFNGVTRDQNGVVRPVVTRSFTSLSQAAEENGQSRIYLGIHWSFDKTEGIHQGSQIADYVFQHLAQRVKHRGHDKLEDRFDHFDDSAPGPRHDAIAAAVQQLFAAGHCQTAGPIAGNADQWSTQAPLTHAIDKAGATGAEPSHDLLETHRGQFNNRLAAGKSRGAADLLFDELGGDQEMW